MVSNKHTSGVYFSSSWGLQQPPLVRAMTKLCETNYYECICGLNIKATIDDITACQYLTQERNKDGLLCAHKLVQQQQLQ